VEKPFGTARLDDLWRSTAISDSITIRNISSGAREAGTCGDIFLLYCPSPDIYVAVASEDRTPVEFRVSPAQSKGGCPDIAGNDYPLVRILDVTPGTTASTTSRLTVTLVPIGY
jgi:hypothetical protein